ncbi:MAG: transposase [Candidatus Omnitrophica bacterium]|nr:transposase [Candidatus Omnitrophota bacterium]
MPRRDSLHTDQIYHVFNRSIAGYVIFSNSHEYSHMVQTLRHYQSSLTPGKFSDHIHANTLCLSNKARQQPSIKPVNLIAYCLMPTHFHLIVKQAADNGITRFMANVQNSYARYFNIKHTRKGPLWEGRFKNVLVKTDEQLLHLTRYIHLNPVTANLVSSPEDWVFSSYAEYTK